MFNSAETSKGSFLEQTKAAREERALEKRRDNAAIVIQSCVRRWLAKLFYTRQILLDFDKVFVDASDNNENTDNKPEQKTAIEIYHLASRFISIWQLERDRNRLQHLCNYIVTSLQNESPKRSYVGVALNKEWSLSWIRHIKLLLLNSCLTLETLRPETSSDGPCLAVLLHTLVALTSTNSWVVLKARGLEPLRPGLAQLCHNITGFIVQKGFYITVKCLLVKGLCRPRVALKSVSLNAIMTLALRPLLYAQFTENLMTMFIIHVMSVPALVLHVKEVAPESMSALQSNSILSQCLLLLASEQSLRIIFHTLEGSHALCLLANLVHLFAIQHETGIDCSFPTFSTVVTRLLETIQHYVVTKQSNLTHWHPMLGWFSQAPDQSLFESIALVKRQIHLLWSQTIVRILLGTTLSSLSEGVETTEPQVSTSLLRRAMESRANRVNSHKTCRKLCSPEIFRVAMICSMYHTALCTLTQLRLDILTGLCYNDAVLYELWLLLHSLGPQCGLKSFLDLLVVSPKGTAPELHMLILFCDCMTHYVTILDDLEMYEQQNPFKLSDFIIMANFLNMFLYKAILGNLFDLKNLSSSTLFVSTHTLLLALYRRDCRRSFAPNSHWLAKDIRPSTFMSDLDKGKKTTQVLLQKMPHIIPHEERVQLFRKYVSNEKAVLGLTESACVSPQSTLITVHRDRIVEDGYTQLAALPSHALKGVIRVRFVNLQGLQEAGIDQDGVFKEFLEESIKRVFDPSLNLFRATSEERLYPSPTSHLQDSHLQLFEFVGRMLGKAVYEGIVVDVPFASFFLSQLLGQTHQALYSCMDELPSLDKELYRSLTFIKHHQGDVSDLELMFSVDEDVLGKIVTHELIPGGKAIPVTNDNKINYIHLMAHFRMNTQIREQTAAFIRGFRSIINPDWLSLFSTPELQRLISGDTAPLDLRDLRRHTQYYGGFHDSHRVVGWLWDILSRDFTEEERGLFLKFVTSCSKPPLLGFAHLEPPFSIRCVEVGDDEDTGDTIGSVIRGFFTIRKKDPLNRLPTSSTCFNLLKLPNYQKKSTLRDKLRYAVSSNTGFELS